LSSTSARKVSRAGLPCHYCKERPGITSDHIVPVVLGGPTMMWNLVPSCPTCNADKKDYWPSCDCEKCTTAVANFLAEPKWVETARAAMAHRLETAQIGIDNVINLKLPVLYARKQAVQTEIADFESLVQNVDSIV